MNAAEELLLDLSKKLSKQKEWLSHSYEECSAFSKKAVQEYTLADYDALEALASRFGRGVDFLLSKVFRSLDDVEFKKQGSILDALHRAEKRELIENLDMARSWRDLRNAIEHEYLSEELARMASELMQEVPKLLEVMERTLHYAQKILYSEQEDL